MTIDKVIDMVMGAVLAALVLFLLYDIMEVLLASGGLVDKSLNDLIEKIIEKALLRIG